MSSSSEMGMTYENLNRTQRRTYIMVAHFVKRAPGEHLAKGLSKAALIAKINALPPLAAPPTPEPTPPAAEPFTVASYAAAHGLNPRELRQKLRAAGLKAPYTLEQVEKVMK
jgi:hypothetical protein